LTDPTEKPPIGTLVEELVGDTRVFLQAEADRLRAYGRRAAISGAIALGLIIAGIALLQGAIIALLTGLILWLQPTLGTGWALIVVVCGAAAIGVALTWIGLSKAWAIVPHRKAP
jgi:hypothetical protein